MKLTVRFVSCLILIFLIAPIFFLHGCGSEPGAPAVLTLYEKCENWANFDDVIEGPADATLTAPTPFLGGQFHYNLLYVVKDVQGFPRNGVCVSFSTDGTFYLDRDHTLPITPSGGVTFMNLRTDKFGSIYVYWATEDLPASGTADSSSDTWITAISGNVSDSFVVTWTVPATP